MSTPMSGQITRLTVDIVHSDPSTLQSRQNHGIKPFSGINVCTYNLSVWCLVFVIKQGFVSNNQVICPDLQILIPKGLIP